MPLRTHDVTMLYSDVLPLLYNQNKQIIDNALADPGYLTPSAITQIIKKIKSQPSYLKTSPDEAIAHHIKLFEQVEPKLLPYHILPPRVFDKQRRQLYACDCVPHECSHDASFYSNHDNLRPLGELALAIEQQRLELEYIRNFAQIRLPKVLRDKTETEKLFDDTMAAPADVLETSVTDRVSFLDTLGEDKASDLNLALDLDSTLYLEPEGEKVYLTPDEHMVLYLNNQAQCPKGYEIFNNAVWDATENKPKPEAVKFLDYMQDAFKAESEFLTDPLYEYLKQNLTPVHFLNDLTFAAQKHIFYKKCCDGSDCKHSPDFYRQFYNDPNNLTELGKLRVLTELKRLEERYIHEFSRIRNRLTGKIEQFLSVQQFLGIYLYSTNLGYSKINTYLRQKKKEAEARAKQDEKAITVDGASTSEPKAPENPKEPEEIPRFGAYDVNQVIGCVKTGLRRLSGFPKYRLNKNERTLIRLSNLPKEVLDKIKSNLEDMNIFLDEAFLSTSFNPEGAEGFYDGHNFKLIISTFGCKVNGAKINGISAMSDEDEFLLAPGVTLHCHGDDPINYDERTGICTVKVCAENFGSVLVTFVGAHKFIDNIKDRVQKRKEEESRVAIEADEQEARRTIETQEEAFQKALATEQAALTTSRVVSDAGVDTDDLESSINYGSIHDAVAAPALGSAPSVETVKLMIDRDIQTPPEIYPEGLLALDLAEHRRAIRPVRETQRETLSESIKESPRPPLCGRPCRAMSLVQQHSGPTDRRLSMPAVLPCHSTAFYPTLLANPLEGRDSNIETSAASSTQPRTITRVATTDSSGPAGIAWASASLRSCSVGVSTLTPLRVVQDARATVDAADRATAQRGSVRRFSVTQTPDDTATEKAGSSTASNTGTTLPRV